MKRKEKEGDIKKMEFTFQSFFSLCWVPFVLRDFILSLSFCVFSSMYGVVSPVVWAINNSF